MHVIQVRNDHGFKQVGDKRERGANGFKYILNESLQGFLTCYRFGCEDGGEEALEVMSGLNRAAPGKEC